MSLDLPLNPSLNDIHQGANGINYQWDGEKWVVFVDPASGVNVWTRDAEEGAVYPFLLGDDVAVTNSAGDYTAKMVGESGAIEAQVYSIHLLPDLP